MVLTILTRPRQVPIVSHRATMYGVDAEIVGTDEDKELVFIELSGTVEKTYRTVLHTGSQIIDGSRKILRADVPQGNWVRYEFK